MSKENRIFISLHQRGPAPISLYVYQDDIGEYTTEFPDKTLAEVRSIVQKEILNVPPDRQILTMPGSLDIYTPGGL